MEFTFIVKEVTKTICILLLTATVCIAVYFKLAFRYWKKKKVSFIDPRIPWGTAENFLRKNAKPLGEALICQYKHAKHNGLKFIGLFRFSTPVLMIIDPDLIKQIMSNDFKHFTSRGLFFNEKDDPLSAHLFSLEGSKWKKLRTKLTPTFTTGKIKMMFHVLTACGDQLKEKIEDICNTHEPADIKDVLSRFTINVIMSAAFGIECNTFTKAGEEFKKYGIKIFNFSKLQLCKFILALINRNLARRLKICITPKDVSNFFLKLVRDTVEYREMNNVIRNDFLQLLINLKNDGLSSADQNKSRDGLTLQEIAAQAFVFFIAGFETSSATMTFCLYELAINPDIQSKLRREIHEVLRLHDGKITYEAVNDMKYLGQVVDETLRKYPPLPMLNRKCCEDYKIPNTTITIEKDTLIIIPVVGLHHDSDYFPNPEVFNPDRFSSKNKSFPAYSYLPFGEGPRICIGLRFGLMQTKVGLTLLLQNFKISLNPKTKTPLKMHPTSFVQATQGGMWLNVEKL